MSALDIKTWQQRVEESCTEASDGPTLSSFNAALGEIKDLRAELAKRAAQPAVAGIGEVDDLAMLVRQLAHSLKKAKPDSEFAKRAVDYLQRKGLAGSPLRAAHVSGQGGEDVRDAARYRLLRCYHISGSWPHEINPNPGILAFSTVKSARELDAMLDDRLAFTLPPNVDKLRPDYIEWRKSSTQAAIDAAIAAKESDSGSG